MLIAGLVLIVVLVGAISYTFRDKISRNVSVQPPSETAGGDSGSSTYSQFAAMTGEEYDRNFIANMIIHHQGAVDMAKLALTNAQRQELKDVARNIVSAQEAEITKLASWQKEWGYPSTSGENMADHSAMGMMSSMDGMVAELEGKTGEEFDKTFIEQMIVHHQSAIDMAAPGEKNAMRQEVKDLAAEVVGAQTREVEQLKQWRKEWGYES